MWQAWMRYIRNFFGFSRTEAQGFSVMAFLLLLAYIAWLVINLLPQKPYQPLADQQTLDSLIAVLEISDSVQPYNGSNYAGRNDAPQALAPENFFHFNPNQLSYDSLLLLGLQPSLARRLVNYRNKGGSFRKNEDLQKIYGFPPELFLQLEPWIIIPDQQPAARARESKKEYKNVAPPSGEKKQHYATSEKFDLNTADSLQLVSVRGIGPVLSSRILKFREALGGFVQAGQLREVWGLSPEAADALLQRAYTSPDAKIRKLNLNKASAAELAAHPYINPKEAGLIVAYRNQHGPFQQSEDLLKIHQLNDNFVKKLAPYLQH